MGKGGRRVLGYGVTRKETALAGLRSPRLHVSPPPLVGAVLLGVNFGLGLVVGT